MAAGGQAGVSTSWYGQCSREERSGATKGLGGKHWMQQGEAHNFAPYGASNSLLHVCEA